MIRNKFVEIIRNKLASGKIWAFSIQSACQNVPPKVKVTIPKSVPPSA